MPCIYAQLSGKVVLEFPAQQKSCTGSCYITHLFTTAAILGVGAHKHRRTP